MLCKNCGAQVPDNAKFCPKCGMRVEPVQQPGPGPARQTEPGTGQGTGTGRNKKTWFGADNIVGIIATILMLLVMVVPFVSVNYVIGSESFTLFQALDLTELLSDSQGLETLFIILFVVFILLFIIFKFAGRNRILSTIGCVGSWALFAACIILIIITNNSVNASLENYLNMNFSYNLLYIGFGFYVWIVGGILEVVSLVLDKRRRRAV